MAPVSQFCIKRRNIISFRWGRKYDCSRLKQPPSKKNFSFPPSTMLLTTPPSIDMVPPVIDGFSIVLGETHAFYLFLISFGLTLLSQSLPSCSLLSDILPSCKCSPNIVGLTGMMKF